MFEKIAKTIREDLKNGEWHNDFLKDAEADRLREAVQHLEKCGVSCYDLRDLIGKLDWYIDANENRVRKLQKSLNALRISPSLLEDGILGAKTISAWGDFYKEFQNANCPKLQWKTAPLRAGTTDVSELEKLSQSMSGYGVLEKGLKNMESVATKIKAGEWQKNFRELHELFPSLRSASYLSDNFFISQRAKRFLDDMGSSVRVVEKAGNVFAVAGVVADALIAGAEVYDDVKYDGKLGRKGYGAVLGTATSYAIGSMISNWGGGLTIGAKLGAVFGPTGAVIGAVVVPIILTIVGEETAGSLVRWVVEVTDLKKELYGPTMAKHFSLE